MITRILAVALLAATAAPAAEAATIIRNGDRIVLTGSIQEGDDAAFAVAVDSGVRMVVLGSDGGRVTEAMAIGRLIRERHLDTAVPSSCVSACALIWAAGQRRTVNGRLAMHCPTFPGELQCYAPARQTMIAYLREMGAPAAVIDLQEAAGSTSPLWVPAELLTAQPPVADEGPVEEEPAEPPPPRRHPRPRYHEPWPGGPPTAYPPPVYYPLPPITFPWGPCPISMLLSFGTVCI
jgi:hypothetical protein